MEWMLLIGLVGAAIALLPALLPGRGRDTERYHALWSQTASSLKRQYVGLAKAAVVVVIATSLLALFGQMPPFVPIGFLTGALCAAAAEAVALRAFCRASAAEEPSRFPPVGAPLSSMGFALLDLTLWLLLLWFGFGKTPEMIGEIMLPFGLGAAAVALSTRSGGLLARGAALSAPETAWAGHLGDEAAVSADLTESLLCAIPAAFFLGVNGGCGLAGLLVPLLLPVGGVLCVLLSALLFSFLPKPAAGRPALFGGLAALLMALTAFFLFRGFLPEKTGLYGAVLCGLVAGWLLQGLPSFYGAIRAWRHGDQRDVGTDRVKLAVLALLVVAVAALTAFLVCGGETPADRLYGLALAAVGMLSLVGTAALPRCSKEADCPPSRAGYAVGAGALTALSLLAAYVSFSAGETPPTFDLSQPPVLLGLVLGAATCLGVAGWTHAATRRAEDNAPDRQVAPRLTLSSSLLAALAPVLAGLLLGSGGTVGLLAGTVTANLAVAFWAAYAQDPRCPLSLGISLKLIPLCALVCAPWVASFNLWGALGG